VKYPTGPSKKMTRRRAGDSSLPTRNGPSPGRSCKRGLNSRRWPDVGGFSAALLLRGFCWRKGSGSSLGTCNGLLGCEHTGQGSDFFREPSDLGLIGRDRLLKSLQLIFDSLLGGLQVTERLSSFIRRRRLRRDGCVDAQDAGHRHRRRAVCQNWRFFLLLQPRNASARRSYLLN
jgi:hypothetical protein